MQKSKFTCFFLPSRSHFYAKVMIWRVFLTVVGCWKYKMRYLQTKVGRLQTILGGSEAMSWGILQIFGYKCLGEGDEQAGGFFGGNVGNVEIHQARISYGVLNCPLLGILHY